MFEYLRDEDLCTSMLLDAKFYQDHKFNSDSPCMSVCAVTCVVSEVGAGCSGDKEDLIVVTGGSWAQCSTGYRRPSFLPAPLFLRPWPRLHLLGFVDFCWLYCTTPITTPYPCTHMSTTDNTDRNTSHSLVIIFELQWNMDLPAFCCPFPYVCHGLEPGLWQNESTKFKCHSVCCT